MTKTESMRGWKIALFASMALGLGLGFLLRGLDWPVSFISVMIGYVATIVGIGTSNVFESDRANHYGVTTQRVAYCAAGLALGVSLVTMWP